MQGSPRIRGNPPRSPLDRFLRLFTDVRAGEGTTAVLLALNVFLILTAYYFIKPIREALILGESGAEVKSYASAVQAVLLLGAVPLYARLAGRLPRRKLINRVTVFFVACLVVFFLLGTAGVPLGVPFFLWAGIFNLMVVAQFWAFANDVYTNDEGERLFPLVQFGASVGAVLGSVAVGRLIEPLGIYPPMLLAAAILLLSLAVTALVDRRERRRTEAHRPTGSTTLTNPAATGEFRLEPGLGDRSEIAAPPAFLRIQFDCPLVHLHDAPYDHLGPQLALHLHPGQHPPKALEVRRAAQAPL